MPGVTKGVKVARGLSNTPVLVQGVRTPFQLSGTGHKSAIAADLGRVAIKGLLAKTGVPASFPEYIVMGTVIQEPRTSNLAREAALGAAVPNNIPAHTVTMACISANQAIANVSSMIMTGQISAGIAGGAETMSDVPIRFSKAIRARMLASQKVKGPAGYLGLLQGLKLSDLAPELPAIAEYSTGEVMGASSDRLAGRWGVTRQQQDAFALRSHQNAAKAHKEGRFVDDVLPMLPSGPKSPSLGPGSPTWDNTIKEDSSLDKLASLKPAFAKPHGTHTAGNSSALTDGGSAALIMSEERARAEGLPVRARLVDWLFVSCDPREELLLGPAYAIARLLSRHGLTPQEIDVWEIHEAFAGQVLANLNALSSPSFAWAPGKGGPGGTAVGAPPMDRLNLWGGSLSLGHPFGATGTRLLTQASNRLKAEGGQLAMLAACAAGGQGHAMLVEMVPQGPSASQPASTAAGKTAAGSSTGAPASTSVAAADAPSSAGTAPASPSSTQATKPRSASQPQATTKNGGREFKPKAA